MPTIPVIASVTTGDLHPAPIEPSWVREGMPIARNTLLSRSEDRMAWTLVWDCTAGKFDWHYDIDETIHFLEGSATISDGVGPAKTYKAGDVLFIPRGAVCHWHVESYVRKVAFCRHTAPRALSFTMRALARFRKMMRRKAAQAAPMGFLEPA